MKRDTKLLIAAAGMLGTTVIIEVFRGESSAIVWRGFLVGMPISTVAAIWIVKAMQARRRRRRVARGLCASCGYDIRATPSR